MMLCAASVIAAGTDPAVYLTANLAALATSTTVTPMEQALLDQIAAAVTSIDAAIYDFERISLRDALIAAKQRGVAVRLVADDEARANPSYAPHTVHRWKPAIELYLNLHPPRFARLPIHIPIPGQGKLFGINGVQLQAHAQPQLNRPFQQ